MTSLLGKIQGTKPPSVWTRLGAVRLCVSSWSLSTGGQGTAVGRSHGPPRLRKAHMNAQRSAGLGPDEQRPRLSSQVCLFGPVRVSPPHPLPDFSL